MARSSFIWLVTKRGFPVAAFTVKHELITWLNRTLAPGADAELGDGYRVYKMADNPLIDQSMFTNPTPNVRRVPLSELGV